MTYEITCQICLKAGKTTQYIGESARTAFDRGSDHLADLKALRVKNPLVKHLVEDHPGQEWDSYKMKVTKVHKNAMYRQVSEGQFISNFGGHKVLNQKGEWGQNLPPRTVVEDGRQEGHIYTNPEGQVQDNNTDKVKRKAERGQENSGGQGSQSPESKRRQGPEEPPPSTEPVTGRVKEVTDRVKKGKVPASLRSRSEHANQNTRANNNRVTGMNMMKSGLITTNRTSANVKDSNIQPSVPKSDGQFLSSDDFSIHGENQNLLINRGPRVQSITKFLMCENNEGQPPQINPIKSDKRRGDARIPHSVLVISQSIDKGDSNQEPESFKKEY